MKRFTAFLCAALLLVSLCAAHAENGYMFEYMYDDYFCYDAGTQVCITARLTVSATVTAQLADSDGTVLSEKEFSPSNRQRVFAFTIPEDWTGCHMLSVYVCGVKVAEDFPVLVKIREKVVKRVDTEEKKMAVTIDCGAGGSWSAQKWLDLLAEYDAHATFFITGDWASNNPDMVVAIKEAGHEIGNHSWSHAHFDTIKDWDKLYHEIADTNALLESLTGEAPTLFRVPYGDWSYTIKTVCDYLGITDVIQWNISSHDSDEKNSASFILSYAMPSKVENGSIVLFHCSNPAIDEMRKALDYYTKTCGMTLVTIGELLPENRYVDDNFVVHGK